MKRVLLILGWTLGLLLGLALVALAEEPRVMLPLAPAATDVAARGLSSEPSATLILQRDTDYERGVSDRWASGQQAGILLAAQPDEYPLAIQSVSCQLVSLKDLTTSAELSVQLQAHIYAVGQQGPGALLASSPVSTFDLTPPDYQGWVTMTLSSPLTLSAGEAWIAAIAYHSGTATKTPSLVIDASYDIPPQTAFYYRNQVWAEHYAFWDSPANIGYSMIRATVDPAGADQLYLEQTLLAEADTMLSSGQPTMNTGTESRLLAGDYSDSVFGTMRSLVRFPALTPPDPQAVLRQACLRLSNYAAISATVPSALHAHDVTTAWQESTATWHNAAAYRGALVASAPIMARPRRTGQFSDGLVTLDVLSLARTWQTAPASNRGLMLCGDEQTLSSGQYLRSRESTDESFGPQLVMQWTWSAPSATPTLVPTVDPSQTIKLRLPLVLK